MKVWLQSSYADRVIWDPFNKTKSFEITAARCRLCIFICICRKLDQNWYFIKMFRRRIFFNRTHLKNRKIKYFMRIAESSHCTLSFYDSHLQLGYQRLLSKLKVKNRLFNQGLWFFCKGFQLLMFALNTYSTINKAKKVRRVKASSLQNIYVNTWWI